MSTKFADFLSQNNIDPRRVLSASQKLERLRPEDRRMRLERRSARKSEDSDDKKEAGPKPRSGRPVTPRLLSAATTEGKSVSGPAKTRLLRAVNHVLEQKKKDAVDMRALF